MRALAVESAADARRALLDAQQRGDPFRLALVDYLMPDEDGESLANSIRSISHARPRGSRDGHLVRAGRRRGTIRARRVLGLLRQTGQVGDADGRTRRGARRRRRGYGPEGHHHASHARPTAPAAGSLSGRCCCGGARCRPGAAPRPDRRGQRREPTHHGTAAAERGLDSGDRGGWRRGGRSRRGGTVRPHPDGLRDAGHGRLRGDRRHPARRRIAPGIRRSSR